MRPETIKTVTTHEGNRRHIIRDGRGVNSPPGEWPICLCTYLDIKPESIKEHKNMKEVESLCENCRKRMVKDGR